MKQADLEKDPKYINEYLRAKFVTDVVSVMRKRHLDADEMASLLNRHRTFVDAQNYGGLL